MAPIINGRVIFNSTPSGYPEPGKTVIYDETATIDLDTVELNGGFLIKVLNVSIDPYMRGRMSGESYSQAYVPPLTLGKPIDNFAIGIVVRSEHPTVRQGEYIHGIMEFQNYVIKHDLEREGLQKVDVGEGIPLSAFVGVLGMPGKTAFMGWKEYALAKKGETVFVTAGAGPVGSLVIQLAKQDGLKVIASAGSDEKVHFLKEIGVDVAFNYKTTETSEVLEKEGPIDVYWDNVGGSSLDAALEAARLHARFIECGMMAGYNCGGAPVRNLIHVVAKSITMQGFIVFRLHNKYEEEFYRLLPPKVAAGEIKYTEQVWEGLQHAGDAIFAVQKGLNTGKAVLHVADV